MKIIFHECNTIIELIGFKIIKSADKLKWEYFFVVRLLGTSKWWDY